MKNQFVIQYFIADGIEDYIIIPKFKFDEMEHTEILLYIIEDTYIQEIELLDIYIIDMSTYSLLNSLRLGKGYYEKL